MSYKSRIHSKSQGLHDSSDSNPMGSDMESDSDGDGSLAKGAGKDAGVVSTLEESTQFDSTDHQNACTSAETASAHFSGHSQNPRTSAETAAAYLSGKFAGAAPLQSGATVKALLRSRSASGVAPQAKWLCKGDVAEAKRQAAGKRTGSKRKFEHLWYEKSRSSTD